MGGGDRLTRHPGNFSIYSVKWSGDGREVIAGTNEERVYIFDVETSRVVAYVDGHDDDVNTASLGRSWAYNSVQCCTMQLPNMTVAFIAIMSLTFTCIK